MLTHLVDQFISRDAPNARWWWRRLVTVDNRLCLSRVPFAEPRHITWLPTYPRGSVPLTRLRSLTTVSKNQSVSQIQLSLSPQMELRHLGLVAPCCNYFATLMSYR